MGTEDCVESLFDGVRLVPPCLSLAEEIQPEGGTAKTITVFWVQKLIRIDVDSVVGGSSERVLWYEWHMAVLIVDGSGTCCILVLVEFRTCKAVCELIFELV